jgi:hypothetical protein
MAKKWEIYEGVKSMITPMIGEIFKSGLKGTVYEVGRILDQMVILRLLNGLNQVLTSKENPNLFYEKMSAIGEGNKDFGR